MVVLEGYSPEVGQGFLDGKAHFFHLVAVDSHTVAEGLFEDGVFGKIVVFGLEGGAVYGGDVRAIKT